MAQKKLINSIFLLTLIFLLNSCEKINTTDLLGQEVKMVDTFKYSDNADVCRLRIFKIENFDSSKFKKEYNEIDSDKYFENQKNWKTVEWQENSLPQNVKHFISPNFIKHDLNKILLNKQKYYTTYTYKEGSKNEITAVILYVLIPSEHILYNYEIIP